MALGKVGVVGRFKPLHNGAAPMLEAICAQADEVIIGIGSCNKYNLRNPFTPAETKAMIDAYLAPRFSNYRFVEIPDFAQRPEYADGQRWREEIKTQYGTLDHFVSGNAFVRELLREEYDIVEPYTLVAPEKRVRLRATEVRLEMAKGDGWKGLVPEEVAQYLEQHGLVDRFRQEFGLRTLAEIAGSDVYRRADSVGEEHHHAQEG